MLGDKNKIKQLDDKVVVRGTEQASVGQSYRRPQKQMRVGVTTEGTYRVYYVSKRCYSEIDNEHV